jgi:subtilisin family serine protease
MCDINSGQLIVWFPRADTAGRRVINQIREHQIEHVTYLQSLDGRLEKLGLKPDLDFPLELHLLSVPAGDEDWKANYLQFFYKHALFHELASGRGKELEEVLGRSDYQFSVAPNNQLSLVDASGNAAPPVSVKDFRFGPYYADYRKMIGLAGAGAPLSPVRVLVIDSGIAPDAHTAKINVISQHNVIDPKSSYIAPDDVGHGTAVTMVIADLAPNAEFVEIKVSDKEGNVSEWDALAGFAAKTDADVINLSLQFGLSEQQACKYCGRNRASTASRSAVFESMIAHLQSRERHPVIVAAAGNWSQSQLAYPARFANVLAIGAVNHKRQLSPISNYGNLDQFGQQHNNHFVMPGGEGPGEPVLVSLGGATWSGTSLATAFASGIIAYQLSQAAAGVQSQAALIQSLRSNSDKNLVSFSPQTYGNGMMRI